MAKKQPDKKPVATLNVGGRKLPCRVTMGAMVRFKRATGHDASRLDTSDMEEMVTFVHCCVASACAAEKVSFDMPMEEFADNLEPDALNEFYGSMEASKSDDTEKKTSSPL